MSQTDPSTTRDLGAGGAAEPAADLAALVGSRICHDLISPLGAIGNGVELLELTGGGSGGAEMALIAESVENASARIRFFRIAFGAAEPGQTISRQEILQVLSDVGRSTKVKVSWRAPGDVPRVEAKLVFLAIMCLEGAMPFGGAIEARPERGRWRLMGRADRLRVDPAAWGLLDGASGPVTPATVQFGLMADLSRRLGRTIQADVGADRIELGF